MRRTFVPLSPFYALLPSKLSKLLTDLLPSLLQPGRTKQPPPNIIGDRHKCITCANYDLCSACLDKGIHSDTGHSFVLIKRPEDARRIIQEARGSYPAGGGMQRPPPPPVSWSPRMPPIPMPPFGTPIHPAVSCDGCGESPIAGTRYKCME